MMYMHVYVCSSDVGRLKCSNSKIKYNSQKKNSKKKKELCDVGWLKLFSVSFPRAFWFVAIKNESKIENENANIHRSDTTTKKPHQKHHFISMLLTYSFDGLGNFYGKTQCFDIGLLHIQNWSIDCNSS